MKNTIILPVGIVLILIVLSIILCLSMTTTMADNNAWAETNVQENNDSSSIIPAMESDSTSINDTIISPGVTSVEPTAVPMVTTVPECHPVTIQSSSVPTPAPKSRSNLPPMIPTHPGKGNPLPVVRVN